jgi:hypothetical protein
MSLEATDRASSRRRSRRFRAAPWVAVALSVAAALSSCRGDPPGPSAYGAMFDEVALWVWENGYDDGDWSPDWDDAPFYGPALYAGWGWDTGRADLQGRAAEAAAHNMALAEAGLEDLLGEFLDNSSAILYGTLGVIDYMAESGDRSHLATVDDVIANAGSVILLMGDYVTGFDNYATTTYGPTSITAIFALLYLQHAVLLETDRAAEYVERARAILTRVEEVAWNGEHYLFAPDREGELFLYPNVAMMIALARMHEATGEPEWLERAEAVHDAIQALRYDHRPGYYSPYSAEAMGATTDDYSTLSSTNYALLALALLGQITGDEVYRREVEELLGFVEGYLWVPGDGRVYHHWMDGRLAVPEDPEYYCIGCNLQLLYIIRWVRERLG